MKNAVSDQIRAVRSELVTAGFPTSVSGIQLDSLLNISRVKGEKIDAGLKPYLGDGWSDIVSAVVVGCAVSGVVLHSLGISPPGSQSNGSSDPKMGS